MLGFSRKDFLQTLHFFKMNLKDRYLGTLLGGVWAFFNPIVMLTLYTVVFGFIFPSRLPGSNTTLGYAIWLISGYGAWLAISEGIVAGTNAIVANSGLVKNVSFKTEVLPLAASLTGLVAQSVSLFFLAVLLIVNSDALSWHIILVVPVMMLQFFLIGALSLFLAPIQVFVRDFGVILPNLLTISMFATPIFYPISILPEPLQKISFFNPFFAITDAYRTVIIEHQAPNLENLASTFAISWILFFLGLKFFRRLKGHFESMI